MKTELFKDACSDGLEYLKSQKDFKSAWNNCKRVDWMLWALNSIGYNDEKKLRLFACKCACDTPIGNGKVVYELLTYDRSKKAIEVSILYACGKATKEELSAASSAAYYAARSAARSAAYYAARSAARSAAYYAARSAADSAQSDFLRSFITYDDIKGYLK